MRHCRKIINLVIFTLFTIILRGQGVIDILDGNSLDKMSACPKTEYQYWVDTKPNYGIYEWKITGGSFVS